MKLSNVKAMVLKGVTAGLLAGAFALAAPAKADAQVVVQVGHPHYAYGYRGPVVYAAPGYYAPGYYAWHHPVPAYRYGYGYRRRW